MQTRIMLKIKIVEKTVIKVGNDFKNQWIYLVRLLDI